jgi:hypothetical protein
MLSAGPSPAKGATNETVLKTVYDRSTDETLLVERDTYIQNIWGYACPVPAVHLNAWHANDRLLRHNNGFSSDIVRRLALEIKDPNYRFCNTIPDMKKLFGEDFKVGAKLKIRIRVVRQVILATTSHGITEKLLRESISTQIGGTELESVAEIRLSDLE